MILFRSSGILRNMIYFYVKGNEVEVVTYQQYLGLILVIGYHGRKLSKLGQLKPEKQVLVFININMNLVILTQLMTLKCLMRL